MVRSDVASDSSSRRARGPVSIGDEELGDGPTEDLVTRPPEEEFGLTVPLGQHTAGVGFDERVAGHVEDVLDPGPQSAHQQLAVSTTTVLSGAAPLPFSHWTPVLSYLVADRCAVAPSGSGC